MRTTRVIREPKKTIFTNLLRLVPLLVVVLFVRNLFIAESLGAVLDEYIDVVTDPAHMLAELTFVLAEALVLAPIVAFWVRRHDLRHHGVTHETSAGDTSDRVDIGHE